MKNQFFYTRKETISKPIDDEGNVISEEIEHRDSFNVNMVIRSVMMNNNTLIVLLNDIHQRTLEVPNINIKTNKVSGSKKQTNTYQTEIYLTGKDIERFFNLLNIEY